MNKTKRWTGPVQETYLHVGAHGEEEAKAHVLQARDTPGSSSLEPNSLGRTGGHVAQQTVPLSRAAHWEAGDGRSCQPPAAGVSGQRVGERFWHHARKVCKTYPICGVDLRRRTLYYGSIFSKKLTPEVLSLAGESGDDPHPATLPYILLLE
ncbi:hypothetical protein WISP_132874 [Willisornis vidua]|uniref:Uncharacterized protein n=1 Tax=Willisornis vidua TaxID=1566151 RepID=A0ABQ9CUM6_9PASS|nr:hypothetical protein WISP_132874 [Willisornis vidua]